MATLFDSTEVEWGQFELHFNGIRVAKVTGIKYGVESDDEEIYGEGDEPIDIKSGNRKYSGEVKMLQGAYNAINEASKAAGYRDITDVPAKVTSIISVYRAKGNRQLQTHTLFGIKINKFENGFDQGAKKMECSYPFKFLKLI